MNMINRAKVLRDSAPVSLPLLRACWDAIDRLAKGATIAAVGINFERTGSAVAVRKDGLTLVELPLRPSRQQLVGELLGRIEIHARAIAEQLDHELRSRLRVPQDHVFTFDIDECVRWVGTIGAKDISAHIGPATPNRNNTEQIYAEFRIFTDQPRAVIFAKTGRQIFLENINLLEEHNSFPKADDYTALADTMAATFNQATTEPALAAARARHAARASTTAMANEALEDEAPTGPRR